ncbi:uncharacterized protein BJX67DRAFT_388836 [Aspergillus lucknowensis]|uniref:Uncharacterized protein n=1 Tax=Aspergillus lucknowensis TaxID=176173 RepID=A0ABR4LNR3_9EURO
MPLYHPTSWREKRLAKGRFSDPKKKAKADRERFRRNKWACFKRLNDLYLDGLDVGRERRIYVLVSSKAKGHSGSIQYTTYNSHPNEEWVPAPDAVTENWPQTEEWKPTDFEGKAKKNHHMESGNTPREGQYRFHISAPPKLKLPLTPVLAQFSWGNI